MLKAAGVIPKGSTALPDRTIAWVTDDSKSVQKDTLFIAARGVSLDGHRFIPQAIHKGAKAILAEQGVVVPEEVVLIRVPATRPLVGPLLHTFLGSPSRNLQTIGVTGTNGKTTVTWLIQHILEGAGVSCGLMGTVFDRVGRQNQISSATTPATAVLQGNLSRMAEEGLTACAMEVSSHALDQYRTEGINWKTVVFTNLAPEHLDYHGTLENYLAAKRRLFEAGSAQTHAIINRDDPVWETFTQAAQGPVLTYSLEQPADLTVRQVSSSLEGTRGTLVTPEGRFSFESPLIGRHNLSNLLAAVGAVMTLGVETTKALQQVKSFLGVPGRLERIDLGQPFPIFVDYAHTDDALKHVLTELKAADSRKIITVFGCGGERDCAKRPRMGQVAAALSDRVIITSDNPRGEEPQAIAQQIKKGIERSASSVEVVLDRKEAIGRALEQAQKGWLVLIAGKGHETVQILKDKTVPFNDKSVVEELLMGRDQLAVVS